MSGLNIDLPMACSNCAKTGKICTFEWLKRKRPEISDERPRSRKRSSCGFELNYLLSDKALVPVVEQSAGDDTLPPTQLNVSDSSLLSNTYGVVTPSHETDACWDWDHTAFLNNTLSTPGGNGHDYDLPIPDAMSVGSEAEHLPVDCVQATALVDTTAPCEVATTPCVLPTSSSKSLLPVTHKKSTKARHEQTVSTQRHRDRSPRDYVSSYLQQAAATQTGVGALSHDKTSLPILQSQLQLNTSLTKSVITDGLFRIYRDSIESALSCWLTEWTCPYNSEAPPNFSLDSSQSWNHGRGRGMLATFCARICRLDQSFSKWRTRCLSPSEDKAASRILNTAIMAFASQWSHLGPSNCSNHGRSPPTHPTHLGDASPFGTRYDTLPCQDNLDRSFQETLWHQARKALQDCEEVESFRVIFAQLIFAVTQRHLEVEEQCRELAQSFDRHRSRSPSSLRYHSSANDDPKPGSPYFASSRNCDLDPDTFLMARLAELEAVDGPPVYLETALRQLLCWRRKIESISKKQRSPMAKVFTDQTAPSSHGLDPIDRKTFNMLFWLGIICDTLSAAVSNRPLVVSDEDSAIIQHTPARAAHSADDHSTHNGTRDLSIVGTYPKGNSPLWGAYFLDRQKSRPLHSRPRWPCSVVDAAAAVCEATPVKILMYRKVAQLQALSLRPVTPQEVEGCIQEALAVYQHWNATYGRFIVDCVSGHAVVPASLQSWCVVHAGHWYLGALLLADAIDAVDEDHKSGSQERALRKAIPLSLGLRKDNVNAIAEVARVTRGSEPRLSHGLDDPLYTFDGMTLLSEPWTALLIKCLTKALALLSKWLSVDGRQNNENQYAAVDMDSECLRSQYETCLYALKVLGKKSDVASLAALAFSLHHRE